MPAWPSLQSHIHRAHNFPDSLATPTKAAIERAKITVSNEETGANRNARSGDNGLYAVPLLNPGVYAVVVEATGFQTVSRSGVRLEVSQNARLDFEMPVGQTQHSVTVEGSAPMINKDDAALGTTISRELVQNLPLNGRTFHSLVTVTPGVVATGSGAGGQFSVNGQRASTNYFTIDGVSANIAVPNLFGFNPGGGGSTPGVGATGGTNNLVSIDALQEFRIHTSTFAPEYGRTPGAQVTILTRSGTNRVHGSLAHYLRNDVFDATDWFANSRAQSKSAIRLNNFGGAAGGPIVRNRTFFFGSFEGMRLRIPLFRVTEVPSVETRRVAPEPVRRILDAFPLPNGRALNQYNSEFASGYSDQSSLNASSIRIDHMLTPGVSVFARYNHAPSSLSTHGLFVLSMITDSKFSTGTFTLGATAALTPKVVNQIRLNYSLNGQNMSDSLDSFAGAQPFPESLVFPNGGRVAKGYRASLGFSFSTMFLGERGFFEQRQVNFTDSLSFVTRSLPRSQSWH